MCREGREGLSDVEDNLSVVIDDEQGKRLGHVTRNACSNLI